MLQIVFGCVLSLRRADAMGKVKTDPSLSDAHLAAVRKHLDAPDVPPQGCFGRCAKCICSKRCKLCLRSFGMPHPLDRTAAGMMENARLPRSGDRGLVCDPCRNTLAVEHKTDSAPGRATRTQRICSEAYHRDVHCGEVASWQVEQNDPAVKTNRLSEAKVASEEGVNWEVEQRYGYLWETSAWGK